MAKKETTTRVPETERPRRPACGESLSDLARVRAKSEEELERDIADDPDFCAIPVDWSATAEAFVPAKKQALSLRLDSDVVKWFRDQGRGYQTRINAVLRAFMLQNAERPNPDELLARIHSREKVTLTEDPVALIRATRDALDRL